MVFKVGDPVVIVSNWSGLKHTYNGTVTKIGRRWVSVDVEDRGYSDYQIDKDTGHGRPDRSGFSASYRGWTPEGYVDNELRLDILGKIRPHIGSGGFKNPLTTDQLTRILAILEEYDA